MIRSEEFEPAIEQIRTLEGSLGEITNAHPIKSHLSKARRALKREQDRDKASGELVKGLELLDQEIAWRSQAAEQLLPELNRFDEEIKNTIGLRMQARLTVAQAESIAACLSHHKDISLSF